MALGLAWLARATRPAQRAVSEPKCRLGGSKPSRCAAACALQRLSGTLNPMNTLSLVLPFQRPTEHLRQSNSFFVAALRSQTQKAAPNPSLERTPTGLAREPMQGIIPSRGPIRRRSAQL